MWTAGDLKYRIIKDLNTGAGRTGDLGEIGDPRKRGDLGKIGGLERTGDLGKKEGDLLQRARNSTLDSPSLKSAYRKFPIQ